MKYYGLIGRNISYSFSKTYFSNKFSRENITDCSYTNFDVKKISEILPLLKESRLKGLNVTIPYKEAVIPYLDELSAAAKQVKAVNVIAFVKGKRIGHNTDVYGFEQSFINKWNTAHRNALILGTGGAAKAIAYVLNKNKISYRFVSRNKSEGCFCYNQLNELLLDQYKIIINCTPLGTFPDIRQKPPLPYDFLTQSHYLYDLIYNPVETAFLKEGIKRRATVQNGLQMLEIQAEKSWEIWNRKH